MQLDYKNEEGTLTMQLRGEIDHHGAAGLRERMDAVLDAEMVKRLVLDFSAVSFMDSSGVGLVLGRYKKLAGLGGRVEIVGASAAIERIFFMSGVDRLVMIRQKGGKGHESK